MFASLNLPLLSLLCLAYACPLYETPVSTQLDRRDGTGAVTGPGLAWYSSSLTTGGAGYANPATYTCYSGPASNFPPFSSWMNFNAMFKLQNASALSHVDAANEINNIRNGILNISSLAKVDPRLILAVIILESTGNVEVACTVSPGGVKNCGLMQSYNPMDTSYDPSHPVISVNQMIQDGTQGTPSGPGLVQWFNSGPDVSFVTNGNVYEVVRGYNSGSMDPSNLSEGGANPAYVSDIANYLLGWQGYGVNANASKCNFPTTTTSTPPPSRTPTPPPAACVRSAYVAAPTQTPTGTTPYCCKYHTVVSGDYCNAIDQTYNITLTQLQTWNTEIDAACDNLYLNYAYCVDAAKGLPSTTATPKASSTSTARSMRTGSKMKHKHKTSRTVAGGEIMTGYMSAGLETVS